MIAQEFWPRIMEIAQRQGTLAKRVQSALMQEGMSAKGAATSASDMLRQHAAEALALATELATLTSENSDI